MSFDELDKIFLKNWKLSRASESPEEPRHKSISYTTISTNLQRKNFSDLKPQKNLIEVVAVGTFLIF